MKKYYLILLLLPLIHACSTLTISGAQVGFIENNITPPASCTLISQLSASDRNENKDRARSDIYIELKNKSAKNKANLLILNNKTTSSYLAGLTISGAAYKCKTEGLLEAMSQKQYVF